MSGGRKATSEQSSSVREGMDYEEVYPSGREPKKDLTWSLTKELSPHSPAKGEEGYEEDKGEKGDEGEEGDDKEGRGDDDEEDESDEGSEKGNDRSVDRVASSNTRPFILPSIWTVNDFYPTMTRKVFNTLRDRHRHQIPNNIPLRIPRKFEKCYLGKKADAGMYDAMFTAGLRLPLAKLHRQLANYLGLFISLIVPNS